MQRYTIEIGGKGYEVEVEEAGGERYRVVVDGQAFDVRLQPGMETPSITAPDEAATAAGTAPVGGANASGGVKAELRAPMPGAVLSIAVRPGDRVRAAQPLLVLEAMKMKNPISAPRDGVVDAIHIQTGQSVNFDDLLLSYREG
jgi:biotin carboxyl carrier protein